MHTGRASCDETWQKRGFIIFFGHSFRHFKSKHCAGCKYWEKKDKTSEEYKTWKETHSCNINFEESASAMEPEGTLEVFKASVLPKLIHQANFRW